MNKILSGVVLAGLTSTFSFAFAGDPAQVHKGMLVGPDEMTLYVFDKDVASSGKSACNGPCAANWPPFAAGGDSQPSGDYSIITRDDGSAQWAYKGRPLYYWAKDKAPGDTTGDGVKGVWSVAKP